MAERNLGWIGDHLSGMTNPQNIILFVTDQQRADCISGCLPEGVEIPNLAWIQTRGRTFERAYCCSPICAPARGSLFTGLLPSQTGLVANYGTQETPPLRPDLRTIGHYLGDLEWDTAYCGKWHIPTGSERPGFQTVLGRLTKQDITQDSDDDAKRVAANWGVTLGDNYKSYLRKTSEAGPFHGRSTRLPLNAHPSTEMALRAAHWLRLPERRDRPSFLAFSVIEPHALASSFRVVPAPFDRMYFPGDFELPATLRETESAKLVQGCRNYNGLIPAARFSDDEIRQKIADYMGAVSYCDFLLGLLLESLAANDLLSDSLVIFTSDHGEMLGHHGMLNLTLQHLLSKIVRFFESGVQASIRM